MGQKISAPTLDIDTALRIGSTFSFFFWCGIGLTCSTLYGLTTNFDINN